MRPTDCEPDNINRRGNKIERQLAQDMQGFVQIVRMYPVTGNINGKKPLKYHNRYRLIRAALQVNFIEL